MIILIFFNLLLFALEIDLASIQTWVILIVGLITALWLWKSGLPMQLFSSANSLASQRTTERDDALKKVEILEKEIESLKEENLLLRRECTQRIEINMQDTLTIRQLKEKIGTV